MQKRVLKMVVFAWSIQAAGVLPAAAVTTIFSATKGNTTLDSNDYGGSSEADVALTGSDGNLDFVNSGVSFHDAQFGSTSDINALIGGDGLTSTNDVTVQWTVDAVDFTNGGELRSRGIYLGLTSAAADSPVNPAENLVLRVGGGGNSGAVAIQESTSFSGGGSQTASETSVSDGFSVTLTASLAGGWQFIFTDITTGAGAVINPISGTFANESQFLAVIGGGHFYMAQQHRDADGGTAAATALNISEASIAVSTSSVPEVAESVTYFNLAKYQATTASASGSSIPPQFATDGFVGMDSRWGIFTSGPHWLQVSLATPMTIGSSHLYLGTPSGYLISNFVLQYHDGSNWVDIPGATVTGNILPVLNLEFNSPITAKDFRLYTTQGSPQVKEMALYAPTADGAPVPFGSDLDLNVAKMRQYAYSSVSGNNYPKLAIDGYAHNSSAWASANTAGPHDLEIHLTHNEAINGIHLYSGTTGEEGSQIQNFEVAYHDGNDWVLFDGGAVSNNTNLNRVVLFNSTVTATKIRFRSLDFNQAFVREFVVLPDDGGAGYPLWTDVQHEAPPSESFLDYDDAYYTIENRDSGLNLTTSASGSSVANSPDEWFQVLLNLGTDTYRLRSKESEACFEVALASTNEGAAIIEGTYSSMPHQRWRLVDTGDGTHFQIVNVWSGLALDVSGTDVVQSAPDADQTQHWSFNYQTHYPKKGQNSAFHFNTLYKPSWAYKWNYDEEHLVTYGQYMPMQWGGMGSASPEILRYQNEWYGRANQTSMMGFNEPDKSEQSNIAEETAAYQWPRFERTRLPLVGPCPAQNNGSWRQDYEAIAEDLGLRSEYMALHWYAGCNGGSPQNIINVINNVYNAYGKPIWITEFAVKDWNNTGNWNRNDNYNWLAEFLWRAEGIAHLKKYSLFEWGNDDSNADPTVNDAPTMGLHNSNDATNSGYEDLSECGLLLAGWDGVASVVDETEYIIHNKGRGLRLIDHPDNSTVTQTNILYRGGADQFMFQTAPGGNKYIVGVNDGRRLSCDGSSVDLSPAGTTGTAVEWALNEHQHGWFFIDHPSTGKRLRITSPSNVIDVDNDSNSGVNLQFRFIRPAVPLGVAETQMLPYAESFEKGMGRWVQSILDDFDWRRNSGGTPTGSTGPSGASDGNQYLYIEPHDVYNGHNKVAQIECTFDLSAVTSAELSFDYHMYGGNIDYLAIDVYNGATWISDVWKLSGAQQAGNEAAWFNAVVDLSAYVGQDDVIIRFRARQLYWHVSDIAIDNIRVGVPESEAYALWVATAFAGAPEGTDQTTTGNPDGDRFSNLQEWALVTDPLQADNPVLVPSVSPANFVALYHRRDPAVTGIDVYASWATSLTSTVWKLHGDGMTETSEGWSNDVETVSASLPLDHTNAFIRIQANEH